MADRHKNRTLESEALRLQEYRAKTTDLGAVLDEAIAKGEAPGYNGPERFALGEEFAALLGDHIAAADGLQRFQQVSAQALHITLMAAVIFENHGLKLRGGT